MRASVIVINIYFETVSRINLGPEYSTVYLTRICIFSTSQGDILPQRDILYPLCHRYINYLAYIFFK